MTDFTGFIVVSYGIALGGLVALGLTSFLQTRRLEAQADQMASRRPRRARRTDPVDGAEA